MPFLKDASKCRTASVFIIVTEEDEDEEGEEEEDEDEEVDDKPQLETVMVQHNGTVNRLKVYLCIFSSHILSRLHFLQVAEGIQRQLVATWSERGSVHVWDTSRHVILLESPSAGVAAPGTLLRGHQDSPLFIYTGHEVLELVLHVVVLFSKVYGYRLRAMDWPGPPQCLDDWPLGTALVVCTYGNLERRVFGRLAPVHLLATLSLWRIFSGVPMNPV